TDNVGMRPLQLDSTVDLPLTDSVVSCSKPKIVRKRSLDISSDTSGKWNYLDGGRPRRFTGMGGPSLLRPSSQDQNNTLLEPLVQQWIEQSWDHFNANEERTFKQKWWFNDKFGSSEAPNFLMIGGEGVEDADHYLGNETVTWVKMAKEFGANLFLLEHRYYGESKLGTNDLQYLTAEQMLHDVATFIRTRQVKENLAGPW
ncbi:hypothetical protein PFISCL1PPCAC_13273, partial [Pristionchus fissidentatus]